MNPHSPFLATAVARWAGGSFAHAALPGAPADRPVLWSVHFDAERLRTGAGRELFADLDPILTSLSGDKSSPGGKLESVAISGFRPQKSSGDPFPFLADLRFSAEGSGISQRFEAVSKKRNVPIEDAAGHPTMHFQHEGKEVWIAKWSDTRVLVGTSPGLLAWAAAAPAADTPAASPSPAANEMLGGHVEVQSLLAQVPDLRDSELLKLLPHLEFHVLTAGGRLDLNASAQLDSERSARRAARMIDGMVAAVAMHDPSGVPWDERLVLRQDGPGLAMQLHLEPQEAKKLFDSFAREMEKRQRSDKDKDDKDDE